MPRKQSRKDSYPVTVLSPIGEEGLDLTTDAALLPQGALARSENMDLSANVASQRAGSRKLSAMTGTNWSKTFGSDSKYALVTTAPQFLIGTGGFLVRVSFTAVRPSGGNTAYVLSTRPAAVAWHVLSITLSDAGVITVTWRDSGGSTRTVACTAVSDISTVHLLAIYDAPAGTFTCYVNGASSGTPLSGLASTLRPDSTTTDWVFGVEKQTGAAVTANTHFDGAIDSFLLMSLAGIRPSSGSPSFTDVMRKHSFREWPAPDMAGVLACYDFNNTSTTVLYDASQRKKNGTLNGTPSDSTPVTYNSVVGQSVHEVQTPAGRILNVVAAGGVLSYERLRGV